RRCVPKSFFYKEDERILCNSTSRLSFKGKIGFVCFSMLSSKVNCTRENGDGNPLSKTALSKRLHNETKFEGYRVLRKRDFVLDSALRVYSETGKENKIKMFLGIL